MPNTSRDTISTTQLARNLSAAIDRVRIQRRPLAVTKGKRTVAELIPPPRDGYPITELPALLSSLPNLGTDTGAMSDDLVRIRRASKLPGNPWAS